MTTCVCRPARPEDRDTVLAFAANTWAWGDYLPQVWDAWLADPQGELSVGEVEGQVVAVGKLSILAGREGWLEGHRVHPAFRQQGISHAFTAYQVERARQMELRVLRLATRSSNVAIHRVAAHLGFHRLAVFAPYVADALTGAATSLVTLNSWHYGDIMNWLGRSPLYRAGAGLFAQGWTWQELTGKKVRELLAAGQIVGLPKANGTMAAFAILGTGAHHGDEGLQVGYVDGEWEYLESLALSLRSLAATIRLPSVTLMLLDEPTLRGIFQSAGFRNGLEGHDLWIYEKVL